MSKWNELKDAVEAVGAKSWSWWTSNSYLRLTFEREQDGGALSSSVCSDGVTTVRADRDVRAFIELASPAAIAELIAENERLRERDAEGYPPCDYCGTIPDHHPWHGSGLIRGQESPHIHACNACRHLLPGKEASHV